MAVSVRVAIALQIPHQLLHEQKGHDTGEHPQTDGDLIAVIVSAMAVGVRVRVRMLVTAVIVRVERVRDQVKKRVAQKTARRKGEQHLQQGLILGTAAVDRNEEEDDEGSEADEQSGPARVQGNVNSVSELVSGQRHFASVDSGFRGSAVVVIVATAVRMLVTVLSLLLRLLLLLLISRF
jgi:hypothetical protein